MCVMSVRASSRVASGKDVVKTLDNLVQIENELLDLHLKIASAAYRNLMGKIIEEVAKENGITLIFRHPGLEAQAHLMNGGCPKPMELKNKSSTQGPIAGLIPINGELGKVGDEYWSFSSRELEGRQAKKAEIESETRAAEEFLKKDGYSAVPVKRMSIDGQRMIAVQVPDLDGKPTVEWMCEDRIARIRAIPVKVLAKNGKMITGDHDGFLFGLRTPDESFSLNEKVEYFKLNFNNKFGLHHKSHREIIESINSRFKKLTGYSTEPLQHSAENASACTSPKGKIWGALANGEGFEADLDLESPYSVGKRIGQGLAGSLAPIPDPYDYERQAGRSIQGAIEKSKEWITVGQGILAGVQESGALPSYDGRLPVGRPSDLERSWFAGVVL